MSNGRAARRRAAREAARKLVRSEPAAQFISVVFELPGGGSFPLDMPIEVVDWLRRTDLTREFVTVAVEPHRHDPLALFEAVAVFVAAHDGPGWYVDGLREAAAFHREHG